MGKALVVYAGRSGETKRIADLIAEGIRIQGSEASVANVTEVKKVDDLEGYDAYVFGSATYHGEMMQGMKTMLFLVNSGSMTRRMKLRPFLNCWRCFNSRTPPSQSMRWVVKERLPRESSNVRGITFFLSKAIRAHSTTMYGHSWMI